MLTLDDREFNLFQRGVLALEDIATALEKIAEVLPDEGGVEDDEGN